MDLFQQVQDFYILYNRRYATLQKLYENITLNENQIDDLKTAIAATEIVPLVVYSPYMFVMLRRSLGANTGQKILKTLVIGVSGFFVSDAVSMHCSQRIWWPITARVYAETIKGASVKEQIDQSKQEKIMSADELLAFKNQEETLRKKFARVYQHVNQDQKKT